MKKTLLLVLCLPIFCAAQKQANIWYFGTENGLDFNSGTPVLITGGQTGTDISPNGPVQEGSACISDSSGQLLFYTSGMTVWNRFHTTMPNGTGLMGGSSSTQSSLIVPAPSSPNWFYIFTSEEFQNYQNVPATTYGYRYSVVDMCMDNARGDVIPTKKNILLVDSSTEKLAACLDAEQTGYWIVGHKMFSDRFYAWHLTSGGITDTVVSAIGTVHGWQTPSSTWFAPSAQGQMKFNAAGTRLAVALGNNDPAVVDLYDFDPATGVVSNQCHIVIDSALFKRTYGVEFSPDGSKLYTGVAGGTLGENLYQFDLQAGGGNCDSVIASKYLLHQTANGTIRGLQVAPDGNIYVIMPDGTTLSRINSPNLAGAGASFDTAFVLQGLSYAPPSFIAGFKYLNTVIDCSEISAVNDLETEKVSCFPNPTTGIVSFSNIREGVQCNVYDVTGRLLLSESIRHRKIDISALASGVYFIRLDQAVSFRIIKN